MPFVSVAGTGSSGPLRWLGGPGLPLLRITLCPALPGPAAPRGALQYLWLFAVHHAWLSSSHVFESQRAQITRRTPRPVLLAGRRGTGAAGMKRWTCRPLLGYARPGGGRAAHV